jgi:nucleoside 2-deoxyribosyltransferase
MDGADPDSGTCWECGYAYKKKWIVLFRTDFRVGYEIRDDLKGAKDRDQAPYNLMLTESAHVRLDLPFKTVEELAASIDRALNSLPPLRA